MRILAPLVTATPRTLPLCQWAFTDPASTISASTSPELSAIAAAAFDLYGTLSSLISAVDCSSRHPSLVADVELAQLYFPGAARAAAMNSPAVLNVVLVPRFSTK